MREVGVLEAKTQLSALIDGVERGGEPVVITRHGKPVARLTAITEPASPPRRRVSGEELVAQFEALQKRIAREAPELNEMTWEDMKRIARS